MQPKRKTDSSWGKVATWYDNHLSENPDSYQAKVILPSILRVLDLKKGERVLDIACGQGFFSKALIHAGAEVTGSDISKELISIAKQKVKGVAFHVAPSHALSFAQDASYDAAIIILALQNIKEMDATFAEAARVLTATGRLVVVLNHPIFRIPKHSDWHYEETDKTQYRRIDRYLSQDKIMIDMHPGKQGSVETISYHRSLQDITKSLRKAGFAIARLEELISHKQSEKGPRQKAEDTARKEIPLFMLLELRKIPTPGVE